MFHGFLLFASQIVLDRTEQKPRDARCSAAQRRQVFGCGGMVTRHACALVKTGRDTWACPLVRGSLSPMPRIKRQRLALFMRSQMISTAPEMNSRVRTIFRNMAS